MNAVGSSTSNGRSAPRKAKASRHNSVAQGKSTDETIDFSKVGQGIVVPHDNCIQSARQGVLIIELVGEPRGKGRPRFTRAGVAYTPQKTRSYEAMLRLAAQDAMAGRNPLEGALSLMVEAFMAIPGSWSKKKQLRAATGLVHPVSRPDFDNLMKPLDALNGVVWRDDAQVVWVMFRKRYSGRPRLVVTVELVP